MEARIEDLRSIPLFAALEPAALEHLAAVATEVEAHPKQLLAQPGAPGSGMFFVVEGTVEVEARETTRELGPGDFFGELALLTEDGTPHRARAREDGCALPCVRPRRVRRARPAAPGDRGHTARDGPRPPRRGVTVVVHG